MFEDWAIIGAPFSDNDKGRAYFYRRESGAWNQHQSLQASDGSDGDKFGRSVAMRGKTMIVGAPWKDNGNGPNEGVVYVFTLQGETWKKNSKFNASDGASYDEFGSSVAISGYTLLVGAWGKDGGKGAAYAFIFAGDVLWDEGTRLILRNGIASGDWFGSAVALSDDMALIGDRFSD